MTEPKKEGFVAKLTDKLFWAFVLKIIFLVSGAIFSGSLLKTISSHHPWLWAYYPYLIASLVILLTAGLFWLWLKNQNIPDFEPMDYDFQMIEKSIMTDYESRGKIIHRKKYKIKALRNGVDRMTDRYNWTGNGLVEIESKKKGQELHLLPPQSVWRRYELRFDRSLRKGDVIDCEIELTIEDDEKASVPFLSTTVTEPTKSLSMSVRLSQEFGVSYVIFDKRPSMSSETSLGSESVELDNGLAIWKIKSPKLYHHYEIRWTFGDC